jgi:hypothetical protein
MLEVGNIQAAREAPRIPPRDWWPRGTCCLFLLSCYSAVLAAQELQPRAYVPTPVGLNFISTAYSNNRGGMLFDPSLPVEDSRVNAHLAVLTFGQTLGVAGRTAQIIASLPYVKADLEGNVSGTQEHRYRSGLGDVIVRYAMNICGAPAMDRRQYAAYRQKTIVGASLTVTAPTGQYDLNRVINIGTNRWSFKPEIGVSRAVGKWTLEGVAGVSLFTENNRYLGNSVRTQVPLGSLQFHVVRLLPRKMWLAGDWTIYTGGRTQVNGADNPDYQGNTRAGATFGIVVSPRQAVKISYFEGVWTRYGNDVRSIGISYNFIWLKGTVARHD